MWWLTAAALAGAPATVVAMGDGLVAGPPAAVAPEVAGGWVASLADCLEERVPGGFTVVDRAQPGETAASARKKVSGVRELQPRVVVLTLGAQELADDKAEPSALTGELERLVGELRPKKSRVGVLLVGMVPPSLEQAGAPGDDRQKAIDARTEAWNGEVAELAKRLDAVGHVDLWKDWPRGERRVEHTELGWHLSEQGHARVAAAVCDAVIEQLPPSGR